MTPPAKLWHVEWSENFRAKSKTETRNYKSSGRAARQVAAILAAPDDVAELGGIWVSDGWSDDRIDWTRLDPYEFLRLVAPELEPTDEPEEHLSPIEHYERIRNAWKEAEER